MLKLRVASEADVETLIHLNAQVQQLHAALEPAYFKAETSASEIRDYFEMVLDNTSNEIVVAETDAEQALGYIWFQFQDQPETPFSFAQTRIYIHHIVVDASARRQGVASALMSYVEAEAATAGVDYIALDTWAANASAQAFFQARGFAPLGRSFALRKLVV